MRRLKKRGALELSINAIVIVILAMTLLGLGLGFVRNMFRDITDTTGQVQDQMKEQILDDLRTGNKKLSFPSQQITIEGGGEQIIAIGVKNLQPGPLQYKIELFEISDNGASTPISSSSSLESGDAYSFFWDITTQKLSPGDSQVFGITLKASRSSEGTKLFKIKIKPVSGAAANCGEQKTPTYCPTGGCEWINCNSYDSDTAACNALNCHHDGTNCVAEKASICSTESGEDECNAIPGCKYASGSCSELNGYCRSTTSSSATAGDEYTSKTFFVKFI